MSLDVDGWVELNLGGNFTLFDGNTYETAWLHKNGLLLFGDVSSVDPNALGVRLILIHQSAYFCIYLLTYFFFPLSIRVLYQYRFHLRHLVLLF